MLRATLSTSRLAGMRLLWAFLLMAAGSAPAAVIAPSTSSGESVVAAMLTVPTAASKPVTTNTTITFSEFPVGTYISNQYQPEGILFAGDNPFIATDTSNPTSPVLSGSPLFNGSIAGGFVDPFTGNPVTVTSFQMNAGYFDAVHSTMLTWFDITGKKIGSAKNTSTGIILFSVTAPKGAASWLIQEVGDEPSGYAIDNVSFNVAQSLCGDVRDTIIKEYRDYAIALNPICSNFTQTAHSDDYSFANLNTGNFSWALIRAPITAPYPAPGLDAWATYIGSIHTVNSAYRDPVRNASVGGAPASRHLFGDAVDLQNITRTKAEHDQLAAAALSAGADYVEPLSGPCKLGCVHADWRYHAGPYVQ